MHTIISVFTVRCEMIANETNIKQSPNDVDLSNYGLLYGLQQ